MEQNEERMRRGLSNQGQIESRVNEKSLWHMRINIHVVVMFSLKNPLSMNRTGMNVVFIRTDLKSTFRLGVFFFRVGGHPVLHILFWIRL